MNTPIQRAPITTISPNDLGYVGLPREAVLDNTATPAEQRAFSSIALLPAAIPAALFAPEAAVMASLLALVGCGDAGGAGDPSLTYVQDAVNGGRGFDGGTTDEGGEFATDNGRRSGGGDALATTDDGGMSTPDDGMTLADGDVTLDGVTDEVTAGNDADASGATDDGDALVAADDGGMSTPDDGEAVAEIAPPPQDADADQGGVTDEVAAGTDVDTPDAADDGDALITADDGGMSTPDDGATIAETVTPPPDADADQTEVTDADAFKDTAPPCTPSCVPVAETVTCQEGSTNVPAAYSVKCATQFVCDGLGTAKVVIDKLDPNTETNQLITVDKCVKDIIFGGCQAINGDLSEYCGPMKIDAKPKPNQPPTGTPKGPTGTVLPSGDQSYSATNTFPFSVLISDPEKDPITVGLNVYHNTQKIGGMSATFDSATYAKGPVTLDLSASTLIKKASSYCYDFKLDDGKGGVFTTPQNCFIAGEAGLLALWTFNQKNGATATDESGNGINCTLGGSNPAPTWKTDPATGAQMLCLGGNGAHVSCTPPDAWKNLDKLSFKARFSMDPKDNPDTFLISWSNEVKHGLLMRIQGGIQKMLFGLCDQTAACENTWWWWATSDVPMTPNQLYEVTGTINMGSAKLFVGGNKSETKAEAPTKAQLGSSLVFGKLVGSPQLLYSFVGCIDEIALYNKDVSE